MTVRFIIKDKNATLNATLQNVACLKCFEKLEVMNYRPKVSEIYDFGKPDKKSMVRPTDPLLKACLGLKRNIFPTLALGSS